MDSSMPGFPVHHQLPELAQTHIHWVSDAIQPSHPLLSSSPPAFNLSQHQGLSQWVSSSHQVAKVLEFHLQHQSFQWIFKIDFLEDWLVWSPCGPRVFKSLLQPQYMKASVLRCSAFSQTLVFLKIIYWFVAPSWEGGLSCGTTDGSLFEAHSHYLQRIGLAALQHVGS